MIEGSNVFHTVKLLLKLQSVAEERFILNRDKNSYKDELSKKDNEIKEKRGEYIEIECKINKLKKNIIAKESEVSINREQVKKIREKEKLVKTQREFIALDRELSLKQDTIKELEKNIEEKNKDSKVLLSKLNTKKAELVDHELLLKSRAKEIKAKIEEINNKLIEINKTVDIVRPKLDSEVLSRYENIVENKNGVGIVPVINNICDGCNLNVTAHVVSKIRKGEELIYCSNCARILYLP